MAPLPAEPSLCLAASDYTSSRDAEGKISVVKQLGFTDSVTVLPFSTPSYDVDKAPYVEYKAEIPAQASVLEVRTLPTLHVYEGRDARNAVQVDDAPAQTFSIHEGDFTSEWRLNVMRGYATRSVSLEGVPAGSHTIRIYMLDPGIILQEIRIQ